MSIRANNKTLTFPTVSIKAEDGRMQPAHVAGCERCDARAFVPANTYSGKRDTNDIVRTLQRRGWRIDKKARLCPACAAPKSHKIKEPCAMAPAKTKPAEADPPRQMTPADRRRIFREIDGNWDEAKARYLGAATDKTIAEAMDVPWAWVEQVRREAFGERGDNEATDKVKGELQHVRGEIRRQTDAALTLAQTFEDLGRKVDALAARLEG